MPGATSWEKVHGENGTKLNLEKQKKEDSIRITVAKGAT